MTLFTHSLVAGFSKRFLVVSASLVFLLSMAGLTALEGVSALSLFDWLALWLLGMLSFLPIIAPLGMAFGVERLFNRMHETREMMIWAGTGRSPGSFALPVFLTALGWTVPLLACIHFFVPGGETLKSDMIERARGDVFSLVSRTGEFHKLDGYIFFAAEREGREFRNVMIKKTLSGQNTLHLLAEKMILAHEAGRPVLIFNNGSRYIIPKKRIGRDPPPILFFDRATMALDQLINPEDEEEEKFILEHMNSVTLLKSEDATTKPLRQAIFHYRAGLSLLGLVLVLITLVFVTRQRVPRASGFNWRGLLAGPAIVPAIIIVAYLFYMILIGAVKQTPFLKAELVWVYASLLTGFMASLAMICFFSTRPPSRKAEKIRTRENKNPR